MKFFDQKSFPITFSFFNLKTNVRLIFDGFSKIMIKTPNMILLVPFFLPKVNAQSDCIESNSISYNSSYYIDLKNQAAILIKFLPSLKTLKSGDCGFDWIDKPLGNFLLTDCNCPHKGSDGAYNQLLLYGQNLTDTMINCVMELLDQCDSNSVMNFSIFYILTFLVVCLASPYIYQYGKSCYEKSQEKIPVDGDDFKTNAIGSSVWIWPCNRRSQPSSDVQLSYVRLNN